MKKTLFTMILTLTLSVLAMGQSIVKIGSPLLVSPESSGYFMAPKWSPDGKTIAVSAENYKGIYLINYQTGEMTTLTDESAAGFGFQWSGDGNSILTTISKEENKKIKRAIVVFDRATKAMSKLSDFEFSLTGIPCWTRDYKNAFMNYSNRFQLYSRDTKSIETGTVLYVRQDRIVSRNISTKGETILGKSDERIINLVYSPDGTKVAYEIIGGPLMVMNIDGTNLVSLGAGHRACWSPDGKFVAYMVTTDDGHRYTSSDIFISSIDGKERINLSSTTDFMEMNPNWSFDGKWIAYDRLDHGKIYIQEVKY
ncbi:MAG: hypothetical protein PHW79_02495 [Candidatus Marinimicrobia bacterium]|nr:hypothetical protein [Candidatus Neomarinimicrobiota bacterium]